MRSRRGGTACPSIIRTPYRTRFALISSSATCIVIAFDSPRWRGADVAALNFHAGPLPEFGGWAFYSVAILERASEYGCTCHHMDEGFDTGDLCEVRRFSIGDQETAVSLERRAQEEMIRLYVDVLARVESGQALTRTPQDRGRMRYLTEEAFQAMKEIPPDASGETIERTARAFFYPPYAGAYIRRGEDRIEVLPRAIMQELAGLLHQGDGDRLATAAGAHEARLRGA